MIEITPSATILVHGGAGSAMADADGCLSAATVGRRKLDANGDALAAAVAAVLVALDVAASPHRLLAGEGATRFARIGGHADFYSPSEKARSAHRAASLAPDQGPFGMLWNYDRPPPAGRQFGCDTVGALVRGPDGMFAVAASTGGSAPALLGRVGDTPLIGCGFYAGQRGAVTVTGVGETIISHLLAHSVYQWIAAGLSMEQALARGLDLFADEVDIGIIAVSADAGGSASKRGMPSAVL